MEVNHGLHTREGNLCSLKMQCSQRSNSTIVKARGDGGRGNEVGCKVIVDYGSVACLCASASGKRKEIRA